MTRTYRKAKRAEAQEETRERIVQATLALHLEQGVATTSYTDVAERAGVGRGDRLPALSDHGVAGRRPAAPMSGS